ncbi:translesion error-prone DNA polymerase V subunit UmuC [Marinomonas sp. THO17]|uniref:translesion error-prone DNA polymerase V subunit UmuC n=1 Tax=Marinomonas sp. THO17 TaxID=3149048 RepID=UPI00336C27DC
MTTVFALVDCNNFYASCEQLFRPDLKNKPVVVLSNNDGCIVARSQEAKTLGLKMGVPMFQVQADIEKHNVVCFSSNYALYADMSNRVMTLLEQEAPQVEVYSIDEAFLDLSGVSAVEDLLSFGQAVKAKVDKWTGISVGIGIAPTKTLAKLANYAAKKYPATGSVVDLMRRDRQQRLLALTDVGEVWGVGRRLSKRLQEQGIYTALDLARTDPKRIRHEYSVVLERTVRELNGESCIALESVRPVKQQIICSRSFGHKITESRELREAISKYTYRAAEKLRAEQRLCRVMSVFIRTSPFIKNAPFYSKNLSVELPCPTDDTRDLLAVANSIFRRIWRPGFRYMKAGVILSDFYEPGSFQADLFSPVGSRRHAKGMMKVLDQINHSGIGHVFFAAQGVSPQWTMKRDYLSPRYTTCWQDLPRVS